MPSIRAFSLALLAGGGLTLLLSSQPTAAQQPDLPKPPPNILNFRDKTGSDLKSAKDAFTAFAKYNAEYIAHPRVYSTPQEFVPSTKGGVVQTTDQIITDMSRSILVPTPGSGVTVDQADYIRELANILDAELKTVIETNPTPVVRVNATRMLAAACKSGAYAHWPTVTGLITNPNTPPEVKYYAFQAAGNLLAAYDLNDYGTRRHAHKPKEVSDLVAALQAAITKPGAIIPAPPAGAALTPEQVDVLTYIRRGAVRALAQVRFPDKVQGGPDLYPVFTLAQVATSDPAISPAPTETEVAEAVIGICNVSAPSRGTEREAYAYAMADAVASGVIAFATRRAASPLDKSLAWRNYGGRMSEAIRTWRALFDPAFDPRKPTTFSTAAVPKAVDDLILETDKRVLAPMETGGQVDVNALKTYRDTTFRNDKKWTLTPFVSNPSLKLNKR